MIEIMRYFNEQDRHSLMDTRENLNEILQHTSESLSDEIVAFDGLALFYRDRKNPQQAGVIAEAVSTRHKQKTSLENPVSNRYIDLSIATVGKTFETGDFLLEPSKLNPLQHDVIGHLMRGDSTREDFVIQAAFDKKRPQETITDEQLSSLQTRLEAIAPQCVTIINSLQEQSLAFPTSSLLDALELNTPSTPNALIFTWDTSNSRAQATSSYGKLKADLALRLQRFEDIITHYNGKIISNNGDGQTYSLEIPTDARLSRSKLQQYADTTLVPMLGELLASARHDNKPPLRFSVDIGYIDNTPLGKSSPVLYELATTSDQQPRDRTTVAFGRAALDKLQLTKETFERLNA